MRAPKGKDLSRSLEDYLETIYELVRDQKVARVRDIARARGVRAASVTPAMRRLADLGLIRYVQREYIDLTPEGERVGRRVFARHQILARFFEQVLQMPAATARADACAMEHSLSPGAMDHLARLFEFLRNCPDGQAFLEKFHRCPLVREEAGTCPPDCELRSARNTALDGRTVRMDSLEPGARARVRQINAPGQVRDRLLDMGLLPDTPIEVTARGPGTGELAIRVQGFDVRLSAEQAQAVLVGVTGESA